MSTEQIDPELIEQTRQQIQGLVREIAQLAKSDVSPADFYGEFLNRVVQALAAVGGAVWAPADDGRLTLQYQVNLQLANLHQSESDQRRHGLLLHRVMTTGEGQLVAPHSGAPGDEEAGNPTEFLLVLAALKSDQDVRGVIEVIQRPGAPVSTQRGYLRFLLQMCELAGDFLKTRTLRHFTDRQTLWTQLENFTRAAHSSLDPRETAYTIANEGRRLIGCDRVSVAIMRGSKCLIEAMSGQDLLDKRSNTVAMLNRLATAVVAAGEPMWYTGDTRDMPPQVEEAIQAYVDESHSKTVAVLPLARAPLPEHEQQTEDDRHRPEPVGALIVEQIEDSRLREGLLQRVDVVSQHSSTALANALEHNGLFLMPVWRALGKARWVVSARTLPKTVAICVVVVGLLISLLVVPYDFRLEGQGSLQPVLRKDVFANVDGTVKKVAVRHNDAVTVDQVVAQMESTELAVEIEKTLGELNTATQELVTTQQRHRNSATGREQSERDELAMKINQLQASIASSEAQLKLLSQKQADLAVRSPIDGVVTSDWNVLKQLAERPVKRGDVLLQVADPSQDWELEVIMPEDRMGHIAQAQRDLKPELEVSYILATDPGTTRVGKVKEVHYSAEVRGEDGNTVLMRVEIDKATLQGFLRPGAEATAEVYCGRRSIGYVWFHDLIAWLQKFKFRYLW